MQHSICMASVWLGFTTPFQCMVKLHMEDFSSVKHLLSSGFTQLSSAVNQGTDRRITKARTIPSLTQTTWQKWLPWVQDMHPTNGHKLIKMYSLQECNEIQQWTQAVEWAAWPATPQDGSLISQHQCKSSTWIIYGSCKYHIIRTFSCSLRDNKRHIPNQYLLF